MNISNPFEHLAQRLDSIETLLKQNIEQFQKSTEKPKSIQDEYVTRHQAASELGVCLSTIDNLAKAGSLKKYRTGRIVRLKKSELMEAFKSFKGSWSRQFARS